MLVTVTFDITTKDQKTVIEEGLYVDIEVTEDEYERIGESCDTDMFRGMYEDITLSEICEGVLKPLENQITVKRIGYSVSITRLKRELTGLRLFGKLDLTK